jgi:hypothetical protein
MYILRRKYKIWIIIKTKQKGLALPTFLEVVSLLRRRKSAVNIISDTCLYLHHLFLFFSTQIKLWEQLNFMMGKKYCMSTMKKKFEREMNGLRSQKEMHLLHHLHFGLCQTVFDKMERHMIISPIYTIVVHNKKKCRFFNSW